MQKFEKKETKYQIEVQNKYLSVSTTVGDNVSSYPFFLYLQSFSCTLEDIKEIHKFLGEVIKIHDESTV